MSVPTLSRPNSTTLSWPMIAGLAAVGLLHPLTQLTGLSAALGDAVSAVVVAVIVGAAWVIAVALAGAPRPFLTCVLAALVDCGVFAVVIAATVLTSDDEGAAWGIPVGIVLVSAVQMLFGVACGALAALALRIRSRS